MTGRASRPDLWRYVIAERQDIVDFMQALTPEEWDKPSWCQGWRIRDVAAHLLVEAPLRELGAAAVLARMARWRFDVHTANDWWVGRNATVPVETLVARMEQGVRPGAMSRVLGAPSQLRAAVIHHEDMRRPLGKMRQIPPDRLRAVLDVVVTSQGSGNLGSKQRADGIRVRATDLGWTHGAGPEVIGPAGSILMALAGRADALADLRGEGLHALTESCRHDPPA